ncbi:hypothetical protein DLJ46_25720 [Micromonospora globispora]|uniref:Uncharacterized protein n=1 Tax=Micromonospora globispora TaxID=1450148 RepID=A0A317JVV9_9ACTN|nr:hypothetical protein DLJ46_25720 [Micromonospora globispora]
MEYFLELIQNVRPSLVQDEFYDEVDRRLHNFVAAAATLIDHTRRLVDDYAGTSFAEEYTRRKDELIAQPEATFVRDLRNFVLHYGLPTIGGTFSIGKEAFGSQIEIPTASLLTWKGWKPNSRRFLESRGEGVVLTEPLDAYAKSLDSLYQWLFPHRDVLHGAEIAEVNRLRDRFNETLTGRTPPSE